MILSCATILLFLHCCCSNTGGTLAFAPSPSRVHNNRAATQSHLHAANGDGNSNTDVFEAGIKAVKTAIAGAAISFGMLATTSPAMAAMDATTFDNFQNGIGSSTQVISARSGGRMGGRSMGGGARMGGGRSMGGTSYSRTTVVRPGMRSSVIVAPPPIVGGFGYSPFGYGYNPMGGFGLGYGLGALGGAGGGFREYRQEQEIRSTEQQLNEAKLKNVELEQRLKALEEAQVGAGAGAGAGSPVPTAQQQALPVQQ